MNKNDTNDQMIQATLTQFNRCCIDTTTSDSCIFNDDLITEILSRLPHKSLLKFMSVSKSWRSLISNCFPLGPVSSLLYWPLTVYDTKSDKMGYFHLPGTHPSHCLASIDACCCSLQAPAFKFTVDHCSHGFFLLSNKYGNPAAYHVYNPATLQCVALPEPHFYADDDMCDSYSALAFHPSQFPHFKVVRFSTIYDSSYDVKSMYVDIFSSNVGWWTDRCLQLEGGNMLYALHKDPNPGFVFANGALYMILDWDLFRFHLEDDCIQRVNVPVWGACIGMSDGNLLYAGENDSHLQIWMLGDHDACEWVLKHTVLLENIEKHPAVVAPKPYSADLVVDFYPRSFHPYLDILFIDIGGKILSYHFGCDRDDNVRLEELCTLKESTFCLVPYLRCVAYLLDVCL